jgi:hypothetical protein
MRCASEFERVRAGRPASLATRTEFEQFERDMHADGRQIWIVVYSYNITVSLNERAPRVTNVNCKSRAATHPYLAPYSNSTSIILSYFLAAAI